MAGRLTPAQRRALEAIRDGKARRTVLERLFSDGLAIRRSSEFCERCNFGPLALTDRGRDVLMRAGISRAHQAVHLRNGGVRGHAA
jgi:hypothetical protein